MPDRELHLIAPLSAVRKRARLAKMVPVLLDMGFRIRFHGWERQRGDLSSFTWPDTRVQEGRILRGGGYVSRRARAMYPLWMIMVFLRVLTLGRKKRLFCLGWETAFPALLASYITGAQVIFDDADRFSMLIRLPAPLHRLLQALEKWASYKSLVHIVPGWSRYQWRHDRMFLLRNTPSTADFEQAAAQAPKRPDADLVLYVNGWIGKTRGAPVFRELMEKLEGDGRNIRMLVAGRVDCADGEALFQLSNVDYFGQVSLAESLGLYHACDVVLTYYDPDVSINRHAESNKWGDCIYIGRPFIVNSEVETAAEFVSEGAAWSVPYSDACQLESLVVKLATKRHLLNEAGRRLAGHSQAYQPFDVQIERLLAVAKVTPIAKTTHESPSQ